ncbi:cofilin [Marasmius crinis-equi]|uniref:Cofilin n=1 Tax=Marasmius crinis-equi TaxID=585013 RepID=A0ABR3FNE1_9AGAR
MSGMSGVSVSDECISSYQELKLSKKLKYIIFNLNADKTQIVVAKKSDSKEYEDFIADLPETECRWAVYDFQFEKEGGTRNKLCFFAWSPDDAPTKQKMVFASSKVNLRQALDGIAVEIQGTDSSEVAYESVLSKAAGNTR